MAEFNIDTNIGEATELLQNFGGAAAGLPGLLGRVRAAIVSLNASIAATPIGLAIAAAAIAIASVGAALTRLQPVVDTASDFMAGLGAAFNFFGDSVLESLGIIERSNTSLINAIAVAVTLSQATQTLRDRRIAFLETESELNEQLQNSRARAQDVTLSDRERIAALGDARFVQNQIFAEQLAQAEDAAQIARISATQTSNDAAANEELALALANVNDIRAAQSAANRELIGQESALLLAARNRADQIEAAESAGDFQDRANLVDEEIANLQRLGAGEDILAAIRLTASQERLSILDTELAMAIDAGETETQLQIRRIALIQAETEARVAASQLRIAIADAEMQTERDVTDASIGLAQELASTIQGLAGNNKGLAITGLIVGQAASVAGTIVDTVRANAAAVAASPLTAGQPFVAINTITAGLGIAAAIGATVQGIQAINASGGPPATGGGGVPAGPTVQVPQGMMAAVAMQDTVNTETGRSSGSEAPVVLLTPANGAGSLESTMRANRRRQNKQRLNRRNG